MDKLKSVAKSGWKPETDRKISRDTWKSDLLHRGKQKDPYEDSRATHQSQPLSALKDPAAFAPPPKHSAYYGSDASSQGRVGTGLSSSSTATGLGAPVPSPVRRPDPREEEEQALKPPPEPYRKDTTGLRTDNLPKPPVRRIGASSPAPTPPPRAKPSLPQRVNTGPPPVLPPRQNEYPDEHAPAPPPTYGEATQPNHREPIGLNASAISRLDQAGVSVPGFGIGGSGSGHGTTTAATPARAPTGQLSELQQRFARMGTGSAPSHGPSGTPTLPTQQQATQLWRTAHAAPPPGHSAPADSQARSGTPSMPTQQQATQFLRTAQVVAPLVASASSPRATPVPAAGKKPPPPPPAKKIGLMANGEGSVPPPIPMSSKPRQP